MADNNFIFLKEKLPELSALGELAEQYLLLDSSVTAIKLRTFAEKYVRVLYNNLKLEYLEEKNLFSLLEALNKNEQIQSSIISNLHLLRLSGNKAAHGESVNETEAKKLLNIAYIISKWLMIVFYQTEPQNINSFILPDKTKSMADINKPKLQAELNKKELIIEQLIQNLNKKEEKASITPLTDIESETIKNKGKSVAVLLDLNEEQTRQFLIDKQLSIAGWAFNDGSSENSDIEIEYEVDGQPTETGKGFVDYVLIGDDGKPLAVIEAKKTSKDPDIGKKQATLYADAIERKFGKRPVIFYTNGFDIYIWNDKENEPPRKIHGFYSKDSLTYLHFKRENRTDSLNLEANPSIANRLYQMEAQKRVIEKFAQKNRKSLIVQATGTGKTRVAVSLCDTLLKGNWVKRILFLCDRRELRKQAKNAFTDFIPSTPLTTVNSRTYKNRDKRIYLSTYPAMLKYYDTFDVGFFDLIIADESHRSIYNVYKDIFDYFDSYQIGLTATPVDLIARNTFSMFNCDNQDPTANYDYETAVKEGYLVPFEVFNHTTEFLREGIKYANLTIEQKKELEDQVANAEEFDYTSNDIDKFIYNKDTNREIIRNLMEKGIKDATDSLPGKTIIFARSHKHALQLQSLFNEMFPQYGGKFCQVIDNYDPRAEQLIDDFKGKGNNNLLSIAISVDMLDTGIDIPEVVNLVFAKPIKSYVKFWQMIGRGTRLCPNLLGLGVDKTKFRIFDHWGNFEWFDLNCKPAEVSDSMSLSQRLFLQRIKLAETALEKFQQDEFKYIVDLIKKDINTLDSLKSIAVKDRWREVNLMKQDGVIERFDQSTINILKNEIAPLMRWINIAGHIEAVKFDILLTQSQTEFILNTNLFESFRDDIINEVSLLQRNLYQVRTKSDVIKKVLSAEYWDTIQFNNLEEIRKELRGLMQFKESEVPLISESKTIDITENPDKVKHEEYIPKMPGMEMIKYKERVEKALCQMFNESVVLQKIKKGAFVTQDELNSLVSLVLTKYPNVDINILYEFYPDTAGYLDLAIRRIIGLEAEAVNSYFESFVANHPELSGNQIAFLNMLKNYIGMYGCIKLEKLYESPFTSLDTEGVEGIFNNETMVEEIFTILKDNRLTINSIGK